MRSSNGEFNLLCRPDQSLMEIEDEINSSETITKVMKLETDSTDFFEMFRFLTG